MHIHIPPYRPMSRTAILIELTIFPLLFAVFAWYKRDNPPLFYLMLFLIAEVPISVYFRQRMFLASRPVAIRLQGRDIVIERHKIFARTVHSERHPLHNYKGIASHTEERRLRTVLIPVRAHEPPALLSWQPAPQTASDLPEVAALRAQIAAASALPDLGYLGACKTRDIPRQT